MTASKNRLSIALVLACVPILVMSACAGEPEPAPRQIARYPIEDFLGTTNFRGASFSPWPTA